MRPKQTVAIVIATALSIVVVGVIVFFGRTLPTSFPALSERPDAKIPGTVAFLHGDQDRRCVFVVDARGGEPRRVSCQEVALESIQVLAWTNDGDLALSGYSRDGERVIILDAESGDVKSESPADLSIEGQTPVSPPIIKGERFAPSVPFPTDVGGMYQLDQLRTARADGTVLETSNRSDSQAMLRTRDKDRKLQTVFRASGPRDYHFARAQWSPDGNWILVRDSEERLIVVAADGEPGPRVLAEDASEAAWFIRGDKTYTVAIG